MGCGVKTGQGRGNVTAPKKIKKNLVVTQAAVLVTQDCGIPSSDLLGRRAHHGLGVVGKLHLAVLGQQL